MCLALNGQGTKTLMFWSSSSEPGFCQGSQIVLNILLLSYRNCPHRAQNCRTEPTVGVVGWRPSNVIVKAPVDCWELCAWEQSFPNKCPSFKMRHRLRLIDFSDHSVNRGQLVERGDTVLFHSSLWGCSHIHLYFFLLKGAWLNCLSCGQCSLYSHVSLITLQPVHTWYDKQNQSSSVRCILYRELHIGPVTWERMCLWNGNSELLISRHWQAVSWLDRQKWAYK